MFAQVCRARHHRQPLVHNQTMKNHFSSSCHKGIQMLLTASHSVLSSFLWSGVVCFNRRNCLGRDTKCQAQPLLFSLALDLPTLFIKFQNALCHLFTRLTCTSVPDEGKTLSFTSPVHHPSVLGNVSHTFWNQNEIEI